MEKKQHIIRALQLYANQLAPEFNALDKIEVEHDHESPVIYLYLKYIIAQRWSVFILSGGLQMIVSEFTKMFPNTYFKIGCRYC